MTTVFLQAAAANGQQGNAFGAFLPLILILLVMWLFMIRPQNKKQKEIQKAREALKPGDKVLTNGGMFGKVREVKDDSFIVEISEGVRVRFDKNAVFSAEEPAKDSQAK